jgi:hypothetical protein
MKIVLLPDFDKKPPADGTTAAGQPARPVDRVAGPAYVVDVPLPLSLPAPADELSASEWSAFAGLS